MWVSRPTAALTIFLSFFTTSIIAQQLEVSGKVKKITSNETSFQKTVSPGKCGFALIMNKAKEKGFDENEFERLLDGMIQQRKMTGAKTTTIYTVPIIFHVVHRGEALGTVPNVSAAQIAAQISQLNNDFSNLAGSAYGVAADVGIRFCAAVVDPGGKPLAEAGIDRIDGSLKGWSNTNTMGQNVVVSYFDATIKPQSVWDPSYYVNMWTAAIGASGLLGWATFPSLSTLAGLDNTETDQTAGVVIAAGTVGSVANPGTTVNYPQGKTATHELGHFFGLRHIWGDATCGDDYCSDTPKQDGPTTGCPASPAANNCIPAANKMFENYMDYSYDACMNTFTGDQTTRAQTVMVNSIRRVTLGSALSCQSRVGNAVQFTLSNPIVSETGSTGTCPVTKTFTVDVAVAVQATGNATLTFNTGGTASNGADYTISPASVTFTNGDNSNKTVTVTIIDDKSVETNETLILGYTISGTGVVAGPEKQVCTITITDDDYLRPINESSPTTTLLTQDFGSGTIPSGWSTQTSGTNAWTVGSNGGNGLTTPSAYISNNGSANTYTKNVSAQAYLITPLINASGLTNIAVSFKWRCKGQTVATIPIDAGYVGYILPSDPSTVYLFNTDFNGQNGGNPAAVTANLALPSTFDNSQFYFVFYWENDNDNNGSDPGFSIDDISITGKALSVESSLVSATAPQYSGNTVQYISADNEIIATVANTSQNVGCITASVQGSSTGRSNITTPTGTYFRTNKIVTLVPSSANTTAIYQGTIYFTTAELSVWSAAEIQNMKILKVKDGVSLTGTLTTADAVVITPTFVNNSATAGYYSYTGNFTGFSQFMGVSPTFSLPVDFISFEANAEKNSILLTWKTASELNNKGFVVERSTNAIDYEKIGWVDGKGTTSNESSYQFTDRFVQPDVVYYYRLRQTDLDNKEKFSQVRQAKIPGSGVELVVSPNPANNEVRVFVKGAPQIADISLVNSIGQQTAYWKNMNVAFPATLSIQHLPKGYYRVIVHLKEGNLSSTLVIE